MVSELPDLALERLVLERGAPVAGARQDRLRARARALRRALLAADLVAGLLGGVVVAVLVGDGGDAAAYAVLVALGWVATTSAMGMLGRDDLRSWASGLADAPRVLAAALVASWMVVGIAAALGAPHPLLAAAGAPALAAGATALRMVGRGIAHRARGLQERTLIIGSGAVADRVFGALQRHHEFGLEPVGLVDEEVHQLTGGPPLPCLGSLGDLDAVLEEHRIDRAVIAFSRAGHDDLARCLRICREAGVVVDVVPRLFDFLDGAAVLTPIGALPLLTMGIPRLGHGERVAKRSLDVVCAAVALVVFAPLFAALAVAVKATSRGPVFFRQQRHGRQGRPFQIWKFRTMYLDAEARKRELDALNEHRDARMFKIRADPRTTPIGRFLRRTSLDELPQVLNVLTGEMSMVGPRPLIPEEHGHLVESWHLRRLDLRPGLTGLWQVSGRSDVDFQDMIRLDYQYVAGWSLARDVEILLATIPAVLRGRGAY